MPRCIEHHLDYRSRECPACEALRLRVENRELRRANKAAIEEIEQARADNREMLELIDYGEGMGVAWQESG
jgi:hypothetical protein